MYHILPYIDERLLRYSAITKSRHTSLFGNWGIVQLIYVCTIIFQTYIIESAKRVMYHNSCSGLLKKENCFCIFQKLCVWERKFLWRNAVRLEGRQVWLTWGRRAAVSCVAAKNSRFPPPHARQSRDLFVPSLPSVCLSVGK